MGVYGGLGGLMKDGDSVFGVDCGVLFSLVGMPMSTCAVPLVGV